MLASSKLIFFVVGFSTSKISTVFSFSNTLNTNIFLTFRSKNLVTDIISTSRNWYYIDKSKLRLYRHLKTDNISTHRNWDYIDISKPILYWHLKTNIISTYRNRDYLYRLLETDKPTSVLFVRAHGCRVWFLPQRDPKSNLKPWLNYPQ